VGKEKQLKREFLQMKSIENIKGENKIVDSFKFLI